jgi:hypothetical protein
MFSADFQRADVDHTMELNNRSPVHSHTRRRWTNPRKMAGVLCSYDDGASPWLPGMKNGLRAKDYVAIKSMIVGGRRASVTQLRPASSPSRSAPSTFVETVETKLTRSLMLQ